MVRRERERERESKRGSASVVTISFKTIELFLNGSREVTVRLIHRDTENRDVQRCTGRQKEFADKMNDCNFPTAHNITI
jgi:hypothetical protein